MCPPIQPWLHSCMSSVVLVLAGNMKASTSVAVAGRAPASRQPAVQLGHFQRQNREYLTSSGGLSPCSSPLAAASCLSIRRLYSRSFRLQAKGDDH